MDIFHNNCTQWHQNKEFRDFAIFKHFNTLNFIFKHRERERESRRTIISFYVLYEKNTIVKGGAPYFLDL